jgi:hypothetical protein
MCVHSGCLSILRIVCLTNLNFIEEKIGETKTRIIITMTAISMAVLACAAQVASGDINSGTAFAFLTRQTVTTGKTRKTNYHKLVVVCSRVNLCNNICIFWLSETTKTPLGFALYTQGISFWTDAF